MAGRSPWVVSDELWELVEPLLPKTQRRSRYPGRLRLPDRQALCGILFVLCPRSCRRFAHRPIRIAQRCQRAPAPVHRTLW